MNYYKLIINNIPLQCIFHDEIVTSLISGIFTLTGIGIAAFLAYRFAIRQKRKETFIEFEKLVYQKKLDALQGCWSILGYSTSVENHKSILSWELQSDNTKKYYADPERANNFLTDLPTFFYDQGLGVYLSNDIKNSIFEYRNIIYGLILKSKCQNTKFLVENHKMVKQMNELHEKLIKLIRSESLNIDKTQFKK